LPLAEIVAASELRKNEARTTPVGVRWFQAVAEGV
jgi:hypothetical protein